MKQVPAVNDVAKMVDVPGGSLRYRWLPAETGPVLAFENGWGASLEQWAWIEKELKGKASLLFYSHAGIGGSTISRTQTAAGLSEQFAALLDALNIGPVVLVGHSFGGLISSLHAAQQPGHVAGFVQLDNTQEVNDIVIDKPLGLTKWGGALATFFARLGIPDPVFSSLSKQLPPEEGARMQKLAFGTASSLRASLRELALLQEIRKTIAASPPIQPRLVISADCFDTSKGAVERLLSPSVEEIGKRLQRIQNMHRNQIRNPNGHWITLPHSHGNLVFTPAGAADSAREVLKFAATLNS